MNRRLLHPAVLLLALGVPSLAHADVAYVRAGAAPE